VAIFGNSEEKPQEDSEKLLQLYWNRAELKKEFADLRNEKIRLQERIKEHEGATARVHQKLNHLEQLLLDPEWVYNVTVYYQLQHLNLRCQSSKNSQSSSNNSVKNVSTASWSVAGMKSVLLRPSTSRGKSVSSGCRCNCSRTTCRPSSIGL